MQRGITETVRLRLETHEFHNYCIMMQLYLYPPACLSVRPSALTRAYSTPTSWRARGRARSDRWWGRKVRLRRGLCNPSLNRSLIVFFSSKLLLLSRLATRGREVANANANFEAERGTSHRDPLHKRDFDCDDNGTSVY